jgi:protein-tyrosine phosphatase
VLAFDAGPPRGGSRKKAIRALHESREIMPSGKKTRTTKSGKKPSGPTEIAPDIFVGGWKDAIEFKGARFCVLDEAPPDMPPATHIPIYNESSDRADPQNLDRLSEAVRSARARTEPVLIFCGHGVRRSPLGGAWYLHRVEGLSLDQAYDRIQKVRPKVEPARDWVGNARELESA